MTVTGLFDPASPVVDFSLTNGGTVDYLYFQAQQNLRLSQILIFGEPFNIGPGDYFFVTVFNAMPDWQITGPPIFYVQASFEDAGRN